MDSTTQQYYIQIPFRDLREYQKGILGVLSKVEVNNCDESLIEDIKSVYKLLSHLLTDDQLKKTTPKPKAHEHPN